MAQQERQKFALITGCTPGGIGHFLALEFAEKGFQVVGTVRDPSKYTSPHQNITFLPLELTSIDSIRALGKRVTEITNGKLDILYNNAGRNYVVPALDYDTDELHELFEANVFAVMHMCREFTPLLIEAKGTIVQTGSVAGILPYVWGAPYNASKAALHSYTNTLRVELAPLGVRVVNVITGGVKSNIARTHRELPPGSYMQPLAPEYERRLTHSQQLGMDTKQYARSCVKHVLRGDGWFGRQREIWEGKMSWIVWFGWKWMPTKIFDWYFTYVFKLGKLRGSVGPNKKTFNGKLLLHHDFLKSAAPPVSGKREYDPEIKDIANYIHNVSIDSELAYDTARWVFVDTLGCGLEGLQFEQCRKILGPTVEGTVVPNGTKVPGTNYQLDPINGAFNIGAMIRWLDFNDCWLAAEWGHPSDNLGAILATADWINRTNKNGGNLGNGNIFKVRDVLEAMIRAHEIQGCMALENSFNKVGLDHVILVKLASTAVVSKMMGLTEGQTRDAVSQAFVDGQSMRTYRHSPNTMSRKSWAAGDACQTAVNLVLKVLKGEQGLPTVLSAPTWGFYDVNFGGKPFQFQRPYGSYVMENVLFKVSYPAEFHSQTAVEAAQRLNKKLKAMGKSAEDIEHVVNRTHEACIRIIDKQFKPMENFADRDHCVQYMVSTMFVFNRLEATDYPDDSEAAQSALVESLRQKISCVEDPQFTKDYHDPEKRTISNALTVTLKDGTVLEEEVVEAPLGHRLRREEAKPEILAKYKRHLGPHYPAEHVDKLVALAQDAKTIDNMDVDEYVDLYVKN